MNNLNCQHDWSGDTYYISKSGKIIYWYTCKEWAHLTTQAREELIYKLHHKIDDPIIESGVVCKYCKSLIGNYLLHNL